MIKDDRELAWLGSGLLRRIALFHSKASAAYSVRSWISDHEWKFELSMRRDVPFDHHRFVERLIDPAWGLPAAVSHSHCSRDGPPLGASDA